MKARLDLLSRQLGWPGLAGLVLIVIGLAADATLRQPLATRLDELERSAAGAAEHDAVQPVMAMAAQLERFHAHFRRDEDVNDWLDVLYRIAEDDGVELGVADYRLIPHPVLALSAYQVTMPLVGRYDTLRAFSEALLNRIPVASLDALRFSRRDVGAIQVEAEMRLTIFVPRK